MVHQYVIKSVVKWLHVLVVFLLVCVYVALFGSSGSYNRLQLTKRKRNLVLRKG